MNYRKWDGQKKFQIVLEGMKGETSISEICNRYQISQTQYYKWRDKFLKDGPKVFEINGNNSTENRLRRDNTRLKTIIGDLTTELKKNDYE